VALGAVSGGRPKVARSSARPPPREDRTHGHSNWCDVMCISVIEALFQATAPRGGWWRQQLPVQLGREVWAAQQRPPDISATLPGRLSAQPSRRSRGETSIRDEPWITKFALRDRERQGRHAHRSADDRHAICPRARSERGREPHHTTRARRTHAKTPEMLLACSRQPQRIDARICRMQLPVPDMA
jgi:hypothetical protein